MTTLDKPCNPCSSHWASERPAPPGSVPFIPCPAPSAPATRGPPVTGCPLKPDGPLGKALPVTSCQGGQGRGKQILQMASCGCRARQAWEQPSHPSGRSGGSRGGRPHPPTEHPLLTLGPSCVSQGPQRTASQRGKRRQTSGYTRTSCPLPGRQPLDTSRGSCSRPISVTGKNGGRRAGSPSPRAGWAAAVLRRCPLPAAPHVPPAAPPRPPLSTGTAEGLHGPR